MNIIPDILFVFFLFMTILVFLPVVGVSVGGASRWVAVGPVQFQPSEFLKIGYILYVAALLCKIPFEGAGSFGRTISKALRGLRGTNLKNFAGGQIFSIRKKEKQKMQGSKERGAFFPFIMVSGATAFLLVLQPDIGTLGLILGVGIILYFISGASFFHITFLGGILAVLGAALAYTTPYRVERLMVFLNPKIDPLGIGYQINQILIAIGSGGISGLGLGMSQQKFGFIPQPIGDSIFAIFAEEFGFIGSIFFITLLLIFLWRGFSIARHAPSSFAYLACVGIISWIGIQAFINIGAMVGLIPLTGIPLPFFSYGGSAMMAILMGMGIVLNISRHTV
ncbi:MAG: FtsW/RodA/SpoVE family cell cycle protein [Bacteroidetes bacterium]|nr:FtsW/RodA/SpoVE family cell cycle protein [Bacteroidota bacterium]